MARTFGGTEPGWESRRSHSSSSTQRGAHRKSFEIICLRACFLKYFKHFLQEKYVLNRTLREELRKGAVWLNVGKSSFTNYCVYRPPATSSSSSYDNNDKYLIIDSPIGAVANEFRMEIGTFSQDAKVARTGLEVLQHGTYMGQPVTKVRLYPHTGRRHQLRVHCLSIGHPIVGDFTYSAFNFADTEEEYEHVLQQQQQQQQLHQHNSSAYLRRQGDRMMLHAHWLRLRLPGPQQSHCHHQQQQQQQRSSTSINKQAVVNDMHHGVGITEDRGMRMFSENKLGHMPLLSPLSSSSSSSEKEEADVKAAKSKSESVVELQVGSEDPFPFVNVIGSAGLQLVPVGAYR